MRAPSFCRAAAGLSAVLLVTAAIAGAGGGPGVGDADAAPKKKKAKKVDEDAADISAIKDQMVVLTDGEGGYVAAVPGDTSSLYWGDGKTMHQQRVFGGGRDGGKGTWSMSMWSPRVNNRAEVRGGPDGGRLSCAKDEVELTLVPEPEARKLLDKAAFRKPLWKRQAHALSRDDRGTYYYVDRLRDEHGGKGFRLFAGQKGAMKELTLVNIVSDSEGQIFASKNGELRFIQSDRKAAWIKGEKRTELVAVPIEANVPLVYGELGIYTGSLGTPCDDY